MGVELNFQSIEGDGINEKALPGVHHQYYATRLSKQFTYGLTCHKMT